MIARILCHSLMLAAIFVASVSPARDETPKAPPPRIKRLSSVEIERLIDRLGSADYRERESATETLKQRPEALPLLRSHLTTGNPEVKRRLDTILSTVMSREAAKRLDRLPDYVKHRQLDRLVETMVAWREYITIEHDAHVRAFVKDIYIAATRGKKHPQTADHLPEFKTFAWHNRFDIIDTPSVIDKIGFPLRGRGKGCGVIASDRIEGDGSFGDCVALCNGDVNVMRGGIFCSVLIATGTVRVTSADDSIIVCPGNVELSHGGSGAVIVSAGQVIAYGNQSWPDAEHSIIHERDTEFFRTWNLYSTTEAGARLWSMFGVVVVGALTPDSPFAKAGIRPGDILARIDGSPIRSVRDANRLFCRATVSWGTTDLIVTRDSIRREIHVSLFNW
jgi:hypothetical protein